MSSHNTAIQKTTKLSTDRKMMRDTPKHMRDEAIGCIDDQEVGLMLDDVWSQFVEFIKEEQERWVAVQEQHLVLTINSLEVRKVPTCSAEKLFLMTGGHTSVYFRSGTSKQRASSGWSLRETKFRKFSKPSVRKNCDL